ncbi:MAG: arsenate reductase/protein-tyrosine-phosphatase family protein [Thermoproteota archaeon]
MNILFVCDGNIFRSLMAEALFKMVIEKEGLSNKDIGVSSAGIIATDGDPPSPYAIFAMKKMGIDLGGFRSKQLTPELIAKADLILTMEERQRRYVLEFAPEAVGKTYTLKAFYGQKGEIYDLKGGGFEGAEKIAREIEECIKTVLSKILKLDEERRGH